MFLNVIDMMTLNNVAVHSTLTISRKKLVFWKFHSS